MLRLTVLVLILANGAYFAWSQGLLQPLGIGPLQQSEPQRLEQQVRPELLRILGPVEARRIDVAPGAPVPVECLQAGPIEDAALDRLRTALQSWPAASWTLEPALEPARWIVYMGKYPDMESVSRKRGELRQIGVSFEAVSNPALEPGLSLGGHASQAAANGQLERLVERGVRTARVLQERPEVRGQMLRLPAVDEVLHPRLEELRPALNGKDLRPCR